MTRLKTNLVSVVMILLAGAAAVSAVAHSLDARKDHDWQREGVLVANDLPEFLHYNPTDGARHEGKVRKAMDPSNIQP